MGEGCGVSLGGGEFGPSTMSFLIDSSIMVVSQVMPEAVPGAPRQPLPP